jgi:transposase InsO family protein
MGKSQEKALVAFKNISKRCPVKITEFHSDNDTAFINWHLLKYCNTEKIEFTRSRPYKKNDNAFVEQKNFTNVRKILGHLRYDTEEELEIINDLYRNELDLYRNFFQPVMFLKEKRRIKSKIIRKYDEAKTPFARIMESKAVPETVKQKLNEIYQNLNPAELKRQIDKKTKLLFDVYQNKTKHQPMPFKKQKPNMKNFGKVLYVLTTYASVR